MSSEMRVTDEMVDSAVRVAIEWDGADAISPQVMRAALHAALLARTEAGADGVVAFDWFAECRRALDDVATEMRATGRGDSRFIRLIESMPRPQDASGDARPAIFDEASDRVAFVDAHTWPESGFKNVWVIAAMQAKEAK